MSTAYDPYQDEDAVVVDAADLIAVASMKKDEPAFMKAFKQVGKTIQNGGFCNNFSAEEVKSKKQVPEIGSPTPAAGDLDSDDGSETVKEIKERSVSFKDLAEPLIVAEEEETTTTTETVNEVETKNATETEVEISSECKSCSAKSLNLLFGAIAIATAVCIQMDIIDMDAILELEAVKNAVDFLSPATTAAMDYAQVQYQAFNEADFAVLKTQCESCPITTGLALVITSLVSTKIFSASKKMTMAGFIEVVCNSFVCLLIAAGIYYTYN